MRLWIGLYVLFLGLPLLGQHNSSNTNFWQRYSTPQKETTANSQNLLFSLDRAALEKALLRVPNRMFSKPSAKKTIISFPLKNGAFYQFLIEETNNFHPDLVRQFPEIRSFVGEKINEPSTTIRFDISPKGFSGMIHSNKEELLFIDNLTTEKQSLYKIYTKKDLTRIPFACEVIQWKNSINSMPNLSRNRAANCQLRTFRLALACTGEYADFHGGTTADALAAMNSTLSIINDIFERELAVRFELIPNTTDLIFLDSRTDPYTNNNLGEMLGEHQTVCDNRIGVDNYDIGHVFSTALGGVAFLGVVCEDRFKAGGATGFIRPEGPTFAIDLVSHELGHQLGASHTFNGDEAACSGNNRSDNTAVEPGSGSTIMGYAGICAPQNIQENSDPYFHAISLAQMHTTLNQTACANLPTNFNNTSPIITSPDAKYFIPPSTPFVLSVDANDGESNELTYSWEQMDNGIAPQPPRPSNSLGPLFRSLLPDNSPSRYFPNLMDLSQNNMPVWEVLPSVNRMMNFRGTVRDNQLNGGCTEEMDVSIEVTNAPPFRVLTPNDRVIWEVGTQKTINWEVGQTNESPINTSAVDIFLSIDGGLTYPIEVAKNLPNTGAGRILVPNFVSTTARIMVKAVDNIFFDISNQNFEITKPENDFDLAVTANQSVCLPDAAIYDIELTATGNFSETIQLSTSNLPAGVVAVFSEVNPFAPSTVQLTLNNLDNLSGNFIFDLLASTSNSEKSRTLTLNVTPTIPTQVILRNPLNTATDITTMPTFTWQGVRSATHYYLEIAEDITFASPIFSQINIQDTTFTLAEKLKNNSNYFWRVRGDNICGAGLFSTIYSFQTINEICEAFTPIDLPLTIAPDSRAIITSELTIPTAGEILSIQLTDVQIQHSFVSDLVVDLISPTGNAIRLIEHICGAAQDLNLTFDSEAATIYTAISCPPNTRERVQPLETLTALIGTEMQGTWSLIVRDEELLDGGALEAWTLDICYKIAQPLIFSSNKTAVSCAGGNDGSLSILAEGGTGNYQYAWSNGATTPNLESLRAGTYGITISDGKQVLDTTLVIEEPLPLSINFIRDKSGCIGENNGVLLTNVFGGTGTYQYEWSNGATTSTINQLPSDNYILTLTDELGCTIMDSIILNAFPMVELAIATQINPRCPSDSIGKASIISNDLSNSFVYEWSNGLIGNNQDSLPVGSYNVVATDTNGCQGTLMVTIEQVFDETPPILDLNPTIIYLDENGRAELPIKEIDAGSFDDCGGLTLSLNRSQFNCQSLGLHSVLVTGRDEAGNEVMASVNIIVEDTLAPIFDCPDFINMNGCQPITPTDYPIATDNCRNLDVQLLTAADNGFMQDTTILSFRAEDRSGNETFCYLPIFRDLALTASSDVIPTSCADGNDGAATLVLSGGQAPFTYLWNDPLNQQTLTATNLASGNYEVTITDNTACIFIENVVIESPAPITITDTIISDEINGTANGSIEINVIGGTGTFRPTWFKDDVLVGIDFRLDSLIAGEYQLNLTDENGCRLIETFVLDMLTNTQDLTFVEGINLYPNPTKGIFIVDFTFSASQQFSLTLYNLLGETITPAIKLNRQTGQHYFDLSTFPNGTYWVKMEFENEVFAQPIILMK